MMFGTQIEWRCIVTCEYRLSDLRQYMFISRILHASERLIRIAAHERRCRLGNQNRLSDGAWHAYLCVHGRAFVLRSARLRKCSLPASTNVTPSPMQKRYTHFDRIYVTFNFAPITYRFDPQNSMLFFYLSFSTLFFYSSLYFVLAFKMQNQDWLFSVYCKNRFFYFFFHRNLAEQCWDWNLCTFRADENSNVQSDFLCWIFVIWARPKYLDIVIVSIAKV